MNEKQTSRKRVQQIRPTRTQKVLLDYIQEFIEEHGYSPSYREIMAALNYKSVATVAMHVNSLIKRGHLKKRTRSARSLEVISSNMNTTKVSSNAVTENQEKWLVEKVEHAFKQVEDGASELAENSLDHLYVLLGALKVLGMEGAAQSFMSRLNALKQRQTPTT